MIHSLQTPGPDERALRRMVEASLRWPDMLAAAMATDAPEGEPEPVLDLLRPRKERRT